MSIFPKWKKMVENKNFGEHSVDDDSTVGELYEATQLSIMRFYLTTKKKEGAQLCGAAGRTKQ